MGLVINGDIAGDIDSEKLVHFFQLKNVKW